MNNRNVAITNLRVTFNRLIPEIGRWADAQFDASDARLGLLEECGEASHCILKRIQGIRGFDNLEHFKSQLADAIADSVIYAAHVAWKCNISADHTINNDEHRQPGRMLARIAKCVSALLELPDPYFCWTTVPTYPPPGQQLFIADLLCETIAILSDLAEYHKIDACDALVSTWKKVSQRNWRGDSVNAAAIAEAAASAPHS